MAKTKLVTGFQTRQTSQKGRSAFAEGLEMVSSALRGAGGVFVSSPLLDISRLFCTQQHLPLLTASAVLLNLWLCFG